MHEKKLKPLHEKRTAGMHLALYSIVFPATALPSQGFIQDFSMGWGGDT